MNLPTVTLLRQTDTHRLIPCKYTVRADSILTQLADNDEHLQDLFDLDAATNDRLWAENDRLPGITSHELVFGIPNFRIINGAFTHAHPLGSRFNSSERGAWYSGFEVETSQAEVIFHKNQEYSEINRFNDSVSYDDYLADFSGEFADLRNARGFEYLLDPNSYVLSQQLAEQMLKVHSPGIVYPSVRCDNGTCIACFRPGLVGNVRKHYRYCLTWTGTPAPEITCTSVPF